LNSKGVKMIDVEIPKKFGDKKYIADFYSLSDVILKS